MQSGNKKILIVEDEHIVAVELGMKLQKEGYTIIPYASSGKDAIDRISKYTPDLIIMDILLEGEIDGLTTARVIRNRAAIPILFASALEGENMDKNIAGLTEAKCVQKPFHFAELLNAIQTLLRN